MVGIFPLSVTHLMQRIDHISLFTSFLCILGIETSFETDWFPVCNQEDEGEKDTQNRWVDFDAQHETEWQIITHGCWYSTASTLLFWSVCSLTSRCIVCETHRECVNRSRKLIQCWSCWYPPLGNSYTNQRIWGWGGGVGRRQDGESQARTSRNRWRERWKERGGWTKLSMLEHSGLSAIWWRWSEVLKINNVLDMSAERFDHWVPNQGIHLRCRLNILGDFPKLQSIFALLWQQSSEMTDKPEQDTIRSGLRA